MRRLRSLTPTWQDTAAEPLPVALVGTGIEDRVGAYDHDGRRRGGPRVIFQYTLSGEGRLTFRGVTRPVPRGTAMLVWLPDDHRYWLPPGGRWEHFHVMLRGEETVAAWRRLVARRGPVVELAADSPPVLQAAALCEAEHRGRIATPYAASALAYALMMSLLESAAPAAPIDPLSSQLARAVEHCRARLAAGIGVAEMARAAGFSRHHFTRLFRRAHGVSPVRFLIDMRLSAASRMLRHEDRTVRSVAAACGFADASHFCRVFRTRLGLTPAEFRERWR
jgi:AraC-like DNA-binding protein